MIFFGSKCKVKDMYVKILNSFWDMGIFSFFFGNQLYWDNLHKMSVFHCIA